LKGQIDDQLDKRDIYELTFFPDPETREGLDYALMRAEAHSIACAQAIHAVGDSLANVVYFSLGMNLDARPLSARAVSLASVRERLSNQSQFSKIYQGLSDLAVDKSFVALDAVVNHGKHRGIVEPRLSIDLQGASKPYAFEFGAFVYDAPYAEKEVEELLSPAYLCVSTMVIRTGIALNEVLDA